MSIPILRPAIGDAFPSGCRREVTPLAGRSDVRVQELLVDHDGCHLHGLPLHTDEDWLQVLRSGQLGQVVGAFALAWFANDGSLTLARDGVGERTLFYAFTSQGLAFATSIRQLLLNESIERRLDPIGLAAYLSYAYLPGWETLAAGVTELPPGELLRFADGTLTRTPFWSIPPEPAEYLESETLLTQRLRQGLEQAVFERLPPSGPVGAFLSGGLDSSLVVALMQRLHKETVSTYSISFGPQYPNELAYSSLVAAHCGTDHHIVELSAEVILHYLDDTIALMSNPIGDPLTVPNALLFRQVSQHVSVVLNGEGGDPCFGGPKNLPMVLAALYSEPRPFQREADYLRSHLKCYDELGEMLSRDYQEAVQHMILEQQLFPLLEDPRWQRYVTKLQMINVRLKGAHHILPKVDALSRPFGVQVRSPLFDRRLVELSFAIPPQWKLRGTIEKYLLKQSVRDILPAAILNRPKSGMMVPVEGWFTGPLLSAARERIMDGLLPRGIFRNSYIERLLSGNLGGSRPRHGVKIWLLLTLEAWLRRVLDK